MIPGILEDGWGETPGNQTQRISEELVIIMSWKPNHPRSQLLVMSRIPSWHEKLEQPELFLVGTGFPGQATNGGRQRWPYGGYLESEE